MSRSKIHLIAVLLFVFIALTVTTMAIFSPIFLETHAGFKGEV